MIIGVDYYPEQWNEDLWEQDAKLMANTGVKIVRLAEFAWCRLEPTEGCFNFEWLDEVIDIFAKNGIDVVLGTPTNCPPRWLCSAHPEILPVGDNGKINPIGIRGHRCLNSLTLRQYAERIVRKMAEHYQHNKSVIAWQIDNELEANICYCDTCNKKHIDWLKEKYGTLEMLNKAYGNVVWSGEYSDWEQIDPPFGGYNKAWLNPAYMLDFRRRTAEDVTSFAMFQADIIRSVIPKAKITTNIWFCANMPDFYGLFDKLDFVSYDNYPTTIIPQDSEQIYTNAVDLDLMRGIRNQNFWIMEQLSGPKGCWMPMQKTPRPGMLKGYSLQAFAHGADTVVHFRWRTANMGAEMHWHGLIDHSNVTGRRFEEFADLCREAEQLSEFRGTELLSDIAVLYSTESEYAFGLQPQTDGFSYMEQIKLIHQAFARYGVNVDIISEHSDFSDYRIICVPALYVVDDQTVRKLYDFAKNGGTVLITARSGVKDQNNNCIASQLPTVYSELVGCHVIEYDPIGWSTGRICFNDGEKYICKQWCDILEADTAKIIARYDSDFYAGSPALTVNSYGKGKAYYLGAVGERKLYEKLAKDILESCEISYVPDLPENIEITTRTGDGSSVQFIFNNSESEKNFNLNGRDIELKPFEMKYIKSFDNN